MLEQRGGLITQHAWGLRKTGVCHDPQPVLWLGVQVLSLTPFQSLGDKGSIHQVAGPTLWPVPGHSEPGVLRWKGLEIPHFT